MKWWNKFKRGLFTTTQNITGITIALIGTSVLVYAFNVANLNIFSSGEVISSEKVNDNFTYLNERLNYLAKGEVSVTTTGTISFGSTTAALTQFNSVKADFSKNDSAQNILNYGYYEVPEDGTYQWSLRGTAAATSNFYAYITARSSITSSATTLSINGYSPGTGTTSQYSRVLSSGDKIIIESYHYSAGTISIEPGLEFTVKRLD